MFRSGLWKRLSGHGRRRFAARPSYIPAKLANLKRNAVKSNILLVGPPGSGKTSVGRELAKTLKRPVIDIDDDFLEKQWNTTVAAKLAELGDDRFLVAEGECLMKFRERNAIVSLTGSNPLHATSLEYVARDGILVYLDLDPQDILQRCDRMKVDRIVGQSSMPLSEILSIRRAVYESSYDLRVIVAKGEQPDSIARKVLNALQQSPDFVSTRGFPQGSTKQTVHFYDVVRQGLAPDRGLFLAKSFNPFSLGELDRLRDLNYQERALRVMERFPLGDLHPTQLRGMIQQAYAYTSPRNSETPPKNAREDKQAAGLDKQATDGLIGFTHRDVLPVSHLQGNRYLMELYHGPTASFKDLSLQLTPKILTAAVQHQNSNSNNSKHKTRVGLLVATSGDTGTAALDGFCREPGVPVIVLYPKDGVSVVQRLQMQTMAASADDILVLGVDADFDFCQTAVKDILNDGALKQEIASLVPGLQLSSANSINWARFLPQTVFSLHSYLELCKMAGLRLGDPVDVCIPTGNFGNILAAFYAKQLGVPIRRLICASNENNVLSDFIRTGVYDLRKRAFHRTMSPSIDILVSSNLERFLYLLSGGNHNLISSLFGQLERERHFSVSPQLLASIQQHMQAGYASMAECSATIRDTADSTGILLDPHTAVAATVASKLDNSGNKTSGKAAVPMLIASTAHWSKFPADMLHVFTARGTAQQRQQHPGNSSGPGDQMQASEVFSALQRALPPRVAQRNPLHPAVQQLLSRQAVHTRTCAANKTAILNEVRGFLQRFAAKHAQAS